MMRWKRFVFFITALIFIGIISLWLLVFKTDLVKSASELLTTVITLPPQVTLYQHTYQWYDNIDALTPVTPKANENTSIDTPSAGTVLRLRLNIEDSVVDLSSGATFKLQYSNSTSGSWIDVSTSTSWVFFDNPGVADGQIIATTVLSDSTVGESYGESNPSAATPNDILQGQKGEWDWVIYNNSASTESNWFFRMIYASSTALENYIRYPALNAVPAAPPVTPPTSPSPQSGGGGGGTGFLATSARKLPIPPPLVAPPYQRIDFNGDSRIDIVDLSVLLYYYNQRAPSWSYFDLDGDGWIDFPDISILMYYWTS